MSCGGAVAMPRPKEPGTVGFRRLSLEELASPRFTPENSTSWYLRRLKGIVKIEKASRETHFLKGCYQKTQCSGLIA
jgi:hypothetical protein